MIRITRLLETDTDMCYYAFVSEYKHYVERERKKNPQNKTVLILE